MISGAVLGSGDGGETAGGGHVQRRCRVRGLLGPVEDGLHAPAGAGPGGAHLALPAVEGALLPGRHARGVPTVSRGSSAHSRQGRVRRRPVRRRPVRRRPRGRRGIGRGRAGRESTQSGVVVAQRQLVQGPGPVGAGQAAYRLSSSRASRLPYEARWPRTASARPVRDSSVSRRSSASKRWPRSRRAAARGRGRDGRSRASGSPPASRGGGRSARSGCSAASASARGAASACSVPSPRPLCSRPSSVPLGAMTGSNMGNSLTSSVDATGNPALPGRATTCRGARRFLLAVDHLPLPLVGGPCGPHHGPRGAATPAQPSRP